MTDPYLQVAAGLVLGIAVCLVYLAQRYRSQRTLPLPPGPDTAWFTPGPRYV